MPPSRAAHLFTRDSGETAYNSAMKALHSTFLALAVMALPLVALADRDKHRHGGDEYENEYWDGNCKVEIKQKHGEYKEKRKCKGPQQVYAPAPVVVAPLPVLVAPRPVYVPAPQPVYVPVQPGLTIQATIPIR